MRIISSPRVILTWLLLLGAVVAAQAQRIQVVDPDGHPVAYVCVTDEQGRLVGSTDVDGWLEDAKGTPVINLSHVAFQDMTVRLADVQDGRITMTDVEFDLPDVEVKPKELAYTQTYYRLIYFDDEGPIYFRGGVIDNTYEFAKQKSSSKTRSLAKGSNGLIRFLISTFAGRYIDKLGQIEENSTYKKVRMRAEQGLLTLTGDSLDRQIISDSISVLGYIDTDMNARLRTTSFNIWDYNNHRRKAEAEAKGKTYKEKDRGNETEDSFYEVYRIDEQGRSRIDDFVMRQMQVLGRHRSDGSQYMILLQAYATDRDYVDKKEYKQLRKDNKVDMEIKELKRFEQAHGIPPLAPNIQEQIDKLFEKELSK